MKDFKVKCAGLGHGSDEYYTIGNTYELKGGNVSYNNGGCYFANNGLNCKAKNINEFNEHFKTYGLGQTFELVEENEMKYKVGDKVEIINTGKVYSTYEEWFDCNCPNYKEQYAVCKSPKVGDIGRVVAMHPHKWHGGMLCAVKVGDLIYLIGIDGIKYLGKSEFAKDDLKTGMFVTVRNGGGYRLLLGTENGDYGLNQSTGKYIKLKCYNDDLTDKNSREWDIVRVDSVKYPENMKSKLLWERKESPIEITIEEIAKKFNVSPGLIRIKE